MKNSSLCQAGNKINTSCLWKESCRSAYLKALFREKTGPRRVPYRDVVVSECPRCAPNSQPRLSGTWCSNDKYNQHLRRVFQIRLSPPQLAAVMASFDKDNDGAINCAEFLLRFFLIGFQVSGTKLGGLHLFADSGWAYISL